MKKIFTILTAMMSIVGFSAILSFLIEASFVKTLCGAASALSAVLYIFITHRSIAAVIYNSAGIKFRKARKFSNFILQFSFLALLPTAIVIAVIMFKYKYLAFLPLLALTSLTLIIGWIIVSIIISKRKKILSRH